MNEESTLVVFEETSILVAREGDLLITQEENTTIFGIGMQGPPGVDSIQRIIDEIPMGAINGSNATFTTEFNFVPESVEVTLNGLAQRRIADYQTIGTNTIIFVESLFAGDIILVDYEVL